MASSPVRHTPRRRPNVKGHCFVPIRKRRPSLVELGSDQCGRWCGGNADRLRFVYPQHSIAGDVWAMCARKDNKRQRKIDGNTNEKTGLCGEEERGGLPRRRAG